jgi:hypothetical protein
MHCYTVTDSGLVHFGNARRLSCGSVMSGKDDIIKEAVVFHSLFVIALCVAREKFRDGNLVGCRILEHGRSRNARAVADALWSDSIATRFRR